MLKMPHSPGIWERWGLSEAAPCVSQIEEESSEKRVRMEEGQGKFGAKRECQHSSMKTSHRSILAQVSKGEFTLHVPPQQPLLCSPPLRFSSPCSSPPTLTHDVLGSETTGPRRDVRILHKLMWLLPHSWRRF